MRSLQTAIDRQVHRSIIGSLACAVILGVGMLGIGAASSPAGAMNPGAARALGAHTDRAGDVIEVRAVARGGRVAVGPRGGVAVRRTTVVRPGVRRPVVRPGYAGGGVRWARPGWYGWPRGGAIAAGAAIGVVTAATAAAWAGAAPAPGMCWYYTDPSRTQGFWDYCR
jgi:hypothetical protein